MCVLFAFLLTSSLYIPSLVMQFLRVNEPRKHFQTSSWYKIFSKRQGESGNIPPKLVFFQSLHKPLCSDQPHIEVPMNCYLVEKKIKISRSTYSFSGKKSQHFCVLWRRYRDQLLTLRKTQVLRGRLSLLMVYKGIHCDSASMAALCSGWPRQRSECFGCARCGRGTGCMCGSELLLPGLWVCLQLAGSALAGLTNEMFKQSPAIKSSPTTERNAVAQCTQHTD